MEVLKIIFFGLVGLGIVDATIWLARGMVNWYHEIEDTYYDSED